jgi:5-methyltetrahydrofolate--homocysteine methyltransferase
MSLQTTVTGTGAPIQIDRTDQVRLIGERINPRPESTLTEALIDGNMEPVRELAVEQVENGADLIDVNVDVDGVDKEKMLPKAVDAVAEEVDVPVVIDTNYEDAEALEAALEVAPGKPVINSVSMESASSEAILPLVAEYETAVVGLTMDESGPPDDAATRVELAKALLDEAANYDIPSDDVIIDPLALPLSSNADIGAEILSAMEQIRDELGNNITLGLSNISYEMPQRDQINNLFLAMAIQSGLSAPIVNVGKSRDAILIADLVMGRDKFAKRYLSHYRSK